jgi:hypothetical protein
MLKVWRNKGLDLEWEVERMNRMEGGYLPMRCPCMNVISKFQQSLETALCLGAVEGRRRCRELGIKEKHGLSVIKGAIEDAREAYARDLCEGQKPLPFRGLDRRQTCCLRFILAFPFKLDTGAISSSSDDDDEGHRGHGGGRFGASTSGLDGGDGIGLYDNDTLFA